jgi:hypothetical protein
MSTQQPDRPRGRRAPEETVSERQLAANRANALMSITAETEAAVVFKTVFETKTDGSEPSQSRTAGAHLRIRVHSRSIRGLNFKETNPLPISDHLPP